MKTLLLSNRTIVTKRPAFIMGIVNVNDDSFWKGSCNVGKAAVNQALQMIEDGADILDFGAESSRPGAEYISEQEELSRLLPVIKELRKLSDIPISIDTRKSSVMKACFECGADILNDISALEDDEKLGNFVAKSKIPVILMHKKGNPDTMQQNAKYFDVVEEVANYLTERVNYAKKLGIEPKKIILDAGIGFAKEFEHNQKLILSSSEIYKKVCQNVNSELSSHFVMALSRKKCIGQLTGENVENRIVGSVCANMIAVQNGATILRVHDVKETRNMLDVLFHLQ